MRSMGVILEWLSRRKVHERIWQGTAFFILVVGSVVVLIPFAWMVSTSLKDLGEVLLFPPTWIPHPILWRNYPDALTFMPFGRFYLNTCIITFTYLFGEVLSCSLVAYGFARLRAPGRDFLFMLMLSTLMLPSQVTMIPLFIFFTKLGWVNTFKPLIVPAFFGSAFGIFLLRQFYLTIPLEMDDAAKIDGCGFFDIYWRIILPLSKPALATIAIFSFMWHWNDFLGPLIYLNTESKITVPLALGRFTGVYGSTAWNLLMAASLVAILPCLALFFFAQRLFIQGIVVTGVKG
ncbi:MAG: carbohydrate ABC transporter permease [bacterium]